MIVAFVGQEKNEKSVAVKFQFPHFLLVSSNLTLYLMAI